MRDEDREEKSHAWFWLGLALGGAVTGFSIFLIVRERRLTAQLGQPQLQFQQHPSLPPINIWNVVGGQAPVQAFPAALAPMLPLPSSGPPAAPAAQVSDFRSYTLSTSGAQRLFTATRDRAWRIQARAVEPAGGVAFFAKDPAALDGGMSTSDLIQVPVGDFTDIFLSPGTSLYGRGSMSGILVSLNITSQVP